MSAPHSVGGSSHEFSSVSLDVLENDDGEEEDEEDDDEESVVLSRGKNDLNEQGCIPSVSGLCARQLEHVD